MLSTKSQTSTKFERPPDETRNRVPCCPRRFRQRKRFGHSRAFSRRAATITRLASGCILLGLLAAAGPVELRAQVAVRGKVVHTMTGQQLEDGMILMQAGKITAIGKASELIVPPGYEVLEAAVVTPGLIDAHSTLGFSGILNSDEDQEQLERSSPVQPELRAVDAYNAQDPLVEFVRSFGITTVQTGHAPGELVAGQTMIVKTSGRTVEEALVRETSAVAVTLGSDARKAGAASPGTRGKMMAMLRAELIRAQEYRAKVEAAARAPAPSGDTEAAGAGRPESPSRDLRLELLARVLAGELPLLVTADRAQDIASALRLAREFKLRLWLDSAAESYLLLDEIRQAGIPVIVHPAMARAMGDRENLSFATAARLADAGVPLALQSGYESYVPKTRVVLFEAAVAAAHGLGADRALAALTIDAARLLQIDDRVGSLAVGKDADLALFDGDPFEYTTHCVGVIINGQVVSRVRR